MAVQRNESEARELPSARSVYDLVRNDGLDHDNLFVQLEDWLVWFDENEVFYWRTMSFFLLILLALYLNR